MTYALPCTVDFSIWKLNSYGSMYIDHQFNTETYSFAWPDPIFVQGRYRFQYKHPMRKGFGIVRIGDLFLTPTETCR